MRPGAAAMLLLAPFVFAQSFETASVKPASGDHYVHPDPQPQSFRIEAPLFDIVEWAYGVQSYRMVGAPDWTRRRYFAIEATTAAPVTQPELRRRLQTLLAERFQLRVHREPQEMPVYAMTGGAKLPAATSRCGTGGCIDVLPGAAMEARYAKAEDIAHTLSNMVDRPVLDRSGLTGRYEYRIEFVPESLIAVLDRELGLKLESTRAAIDMLVIDSVADPRPN